MSKTWLFTSEYVDIETGELITYQMVQNEYIKKVYKTIVKYNGKFNIKHTIYKCRKAGKQQTIW